MLAVGPVIPLHAETKLRFGGVALGHQLREEVLGLVDPEKRLFADKHA